MSDKEGEGQKLKRQINLVYPTSVRLNHFVGKMKRLYSRLKFQLPSKLPKGMTEFHTFCDSIFDAYHVPKTDPYYHSIAVMIQHLPPTTVYRRKAWFAASIYNAQAREVAFYKIQEIQKKDREAKEAEKASLREAEPMPH